MKTTQDFYKYVAECQQDIMSQFEASDYRDADDMHDAVLDYVHEYVDGLQEVIYYAQAWALIDMLRFSSGDWIGDAEEELKDTGYVYENIDKHMCVLAYVILRNQIEDGLYELCEEAFEAWLESEAA